MSEGYGLYVNERLEERLPDLDSAITRINEAHRESVEVGYWVTSQECTPTSVKASYRRSRRDSELPASFGGGGPTKFTLEIKPIALDGGILPMPVEEDSE